jgi:serpin B
MGSIRCIPLLPGAALAALELLVSCGGPGADSRLEQGPSAKTAAVGKSESKAKTRPAEVTAAMILSPLADGAPDPALVQADNGLGRELFRRLRRQDPGGNLLLSPVSAAKALQLTFAGAGGATRDGMALALGVQGVDTAALNAANGVLLADLAPGEPDVALVLANSLWQKGTQVYPAYQKTAQGAYGAEVGDLGPGPQAVNAWMAAKTHGLIKTVVSPDAHLGPDALLLANSVYFKASWSIPFEPHFTAQAPFTRADGSQVACSMMFRAGTFDYGESGRWQALRLPYGKGRFSMVLVLPRAGTALADLDPDPAPFLASLDCHWVLLRLPRFGVDFSGALDEPLKAMGMAQAFDPNRADFSLVGPLSRYIGAVVHAARMNVDEFGTVAAAGTVVQLSGTSLPDKEMTLDRPFLFMILDGKSGEVIFLGQVGDPTR